MDRVGAALQSVHWWQMEGIVRDGGRWYVSVLRAPLLILGAVGFLLGVLVKKVHALFCGRVWCEYGRAEVGGDVETFLQWNVCAMPGGLCKWFGGMRPAKERVESVYRRIVEKEPLVVALMEAHDEKFVRKLGQKLGEHYHRVIAHAGDCQGAGVLGSGILFATKAHVRKVAFHRFKAGSGCHRMVAKGFLVVDLVHKGREFRVIATHLQPGKHANVRARQIDEMRPYIEEGTVIMGDLNIDRGAGETVGLGYAPEVGATCTDAFCGKDRDESVDYIIGVKSVEVLPGYDKSRKEEADSDHHILFGWR